jgi:hypothetical protein
VPGLKELIKTNMNIIKHQHRARVPRPMNAGNNTNDTKDIGQLPIGRTYSPSNQMGHS